MEFDSGQVESLVASALRLLDRPEAAFALDFFWKASDPASEVNQITNEYTLGFSSMLATYARTEPLPETPPQLRNLARSDLRRAMVFLPNFASGNISIGRSFVGVKGSIFGGAGQLDELNVGRYIRDESTGETLVILQSIRDETLCPIVFLCLRHKSTTTHEHISLSCDPEVFQNGRRGQSVLFAISALEHRPCVVCKRPREAACSCQLPVAKMQHAFDFHTPRRNMATHTSSEYSGVGYMLLQENVAGEPTLADKWKSIAFSWENTVEHMNDRSLALVLQQEIVRTRLAEAHPQNMVLQASRQRISEARTKLLRLCLDPTTQGVRSSLLQRSKVSLHIGDPPVPHVSLGECSSIDRNRNPKRITQGPGHDHGEVETRSSRVEGTLCQTVPTVGAVAPFPDRSNLKFDVVAREPPMWPAGPVAESQNHIIDDHRLGGVTSALHGNNRALEDSTSISMNRSESAPQDALRSNVIFTRPQGWDSETNCSAFCFASGSSTEPSRNTQEEVCNFGSVLPQGGPPRSGSPRSRPQGSLLLVRNEKTRNQTLGSGTCDVEPVFLGGVEDLPSSGEDAVGRMSRDRAQIPAAALEMPALDDTNMAEPSDADVQSGIPTDREVKDYIRRMRNRASAARSNAKRKAKLLETRQGLLEAKAQLQVLRARYDAAVDENERLHARVAAMLSSLQSGGPDALL